MDDLDHLLQLLRNVSERGGWCENPIGEIFRGWSNSSPNHNPHALSEPLLSMRQLLEDSKLCMKALNMVRQNLGRNIRALQKRCVPLTLEHGISRLPDELLTRIFEIGHESTTEFHFALHVSHLSHRFRQIALAIPLLWTRLSAEYGDEQTRIFISRTGSHVLDIETTPCGRNRRYHQAVPFAKVNSFLQMVAPLSSRWSHLTLFDKKAEEIIRDIGLDDFPSLRYLGHYYEISLASWKMPLLSDVCGYRSTIIPGVTYLSQITHMDLTFDIWEIFDVSSLAPVLHGMPKLSHLSLELEDCRESGIISNLDTKKAPIRHSVSLQTLKITVKGFTKSATVQALYDILAPFTPSTLDITILTDYSRNHFAEGLVLSGSDRTFFPYASTIRLCTHQPCDVIQTLSDLVTNCDILTSVQIEIPNAYIDDKDPFYFWEWPENAPLRHLEFRNCDTLAEEHVETLAGKLMLPGVADSLESLEFTSCKKLSEDFFIDLQVEFGDSLKWIL
ncbi:hypothetical protein BD410DRAFT_794312 [Rickenella mellea]|uniref:Uncharacterized protein n=1 Tax=Rickenella mellea TaxID=50990 RepID=A0A4Y7PR48_9AGAM|nr:hypothetical protein BD410DRAFT_794312 [Rickenella mellea]